ncbi:MAG: hypothetical protein ACR2JJ_07845 [Sphingomicrobium sp.]
MKTAIQIAVGIFVIWLAWKIIKGLLGILVGIAIAGLIIYGGVKLIEGRR